MRGTTHNMSRGTAKRLRALVVFASLVGDTDAIARAVADGLDDDFDSTVVEARDLDPEEATRFDLIVTGEPSHMFGVGIDHLEGVLDVDEKHVAMKAWLANLPVARTRQFCACFDTATRSETYGGEPASVDSLRTLHELGYVALSRQTFHVASIGGPLVAGEPERARAWARSLAARIPAP